MYSIALVVLVVLYCLCKVDKYLSKKGSGVLPFVLSAKYSAFGRCFVDAGEVYHVF